LVKHIFRFGLAHTFLGRDKYHIEQLQFMVNLTLQKKGKVISNEKFFLVKQDSVDPNPRAS